MPTIGIVLSFFFLSRLFLTTENMIHSIIFKWIQEESSSMKQSIAIYLVSMRTDVVHQIIID